MARVSELSESLARAQSVCFFLLADEQPGRVQQEYVYRTLGCLLVSRSRTTTGISTRPTHRFSAPVVWRETKPLAASSEQSDGHFNIVSVPSLCINCTAERRCRFTFPDRAVNRFTRAGDGGVCAARECADARMSGANLCEECDARSIAHSPMSPRALPTSHSRKKNQSDAARRETERRPRRQAMLDRVRSSAMRKRAPCTTCLPDRSAKRLCVS